MEVIRTDRSINSGTSEVLDKWKNDFEALLNPVHGTGDHVYSNNSTMIHRLMSPYVSSS